MNVFRFPLAFLGALAFLAGGLSQSARADFELTAPDGRTIQLKDNGTWRYAEPAGTGDKPEKPKFEGEAVLTLLSKTEVGPTCSYSFQLVNNLPYEIRTVVPSFLAYRANGVVYGRDSANFNALPPGNVQKRSILFEGIRCHEIVRLQVTGADRCTMGDLDKYSSTAGECLARIRVVESTVVQLDK